MNRYFVVSLLVFFYGVYLVIGALVFQRLEHSREETMCGETLQQLKKYNLTESYHDGNESLKQLVQLVLSASDNGVQFDSKLHASCSCNWEFQNAFFFAGTVITTIGYGNIAPATSQGRIFCIFYATIGLPLFGVMFTEIGSIFADYFKHLEKKLRKMICIARLRNYCVMISLLTTLTIFFLIIPSMIFVIFEKWSFQDAFYYAFITLTTIGFGDFVAGTNPNLSYINLYRVAVYFWILFGLAFMAAVVNVMGEITRPKEEKSRIDPTEEETNPIELNKSRV